jgi:hypothetical protein
MIHCIYVIGMQLIHKHPEHWWIQLNKITPRQIVLIQWMSGGFLR